MITVKYEHPPRDLSFYAPIILAVVVIMTPIFIVIPWWTQGVAPLPTLLLLGFLIFIRLPNAIQQAGSSLVILADVGLPKSRDVSAEARPLPEMLAEAALKLELEGFERFGEIEAFTAGAAEPTTAWLYRSSGGQILAALFLIGKPTPTPFVGIVTYGDLGMVMTTWPRGHQVKLPDARFSGVRGEIEAAYRHHVAEVRELKPAMGRILKVESVEQYLRLDRKFASQQKVWMRHATIDVLVKEFFETVTLLPGAVILAGLLFRDSFWPALISDRSGWTFPTLAIGIGMTVLIGMRSRGITGPKAN